MTTGDSRIYSLLSDDKAFGGWFGALLPVSASELLALMMDGWGGGVDFVVVSYSCSLFCRGVRWGYIVLCLCQ